MRMKTFVMFTLVTTGGLIGSNALADVSGTVYRDLPVNGAILNTYGVQDDNEPGVEGINVTVTGTTGSGTTTTTVDGSWSVTGNLGDVRVEFGNIPSYMYSSPVNTGSNTSVQFSTDGDTEINFGLHYPNDFSSSIDPPMILPIWRNGQAGTNTNPAIYSFGYNSSGEGPSYNAGATGPDPVPEVNLNEVGSIWGLANQKTHERYFAATVLRRHAGMADGTGYIYVVDRTGAASLAHKFDLNGVNTVNGGVIDLGSLCRSGGCANDAGNTGFADDYDLPADPATPNTDLDAGPKVAKIAFGDIDMQPDSDTLWAVNLNQRALISIDVSNTTATALPNNVDQFLITSLGGVPSCTNGEIRPWGLGFSNGKGYLGVVCDGSLGGTAADVDGYILSFNPDNVLAGLTTELAFGMDYNVSRDATSQFRPWDDVFGGYADLGNGVLVKPQPIVSDIEFDENGNMNIGVIDRWNLQIGAANFPFVSQAGGSYSSRIDGDVLHACKTASGFDFEGIGSCPQNFSGEFYNDLSGDDTYEGSAGGLATLLGSGELAVSLLNPHTNFVNSYHWNSVGVQFLNNTTGAIQDHYTVAKTNVDGMFSKAGGLGDIELLTDAAPLEIGNRVWDDTNGNGVQDAGETGIDGVDVTLNCGGSNFKQTTANGGQYLFTDANVTGGIPRNANCTISVPTTVNGSVLTIQNSTTDEPLGSNPEPGSGSFSFTTGRAGQNNHTYDIGYRATPTNGSITIIEDATPDDPQDFAFTATGTGTSNFSLDDDADATLSNTQTFTGLANGTYSFTETSVANWLLNGISCTGNTNSTITTNATGVDITLSSNEDIVCTFYNNTHTCPAGQLKNTATLTANETETTYANNSDSACLEITAACSLTASAVVSACTNGGNDTDTSNDTFTFDITVEGSNTGASTTYNYTSSSANISGNGTYSATAETDGAFTISNTTSPFDLTITDSVDNTCGVSITGLVAPSVCSNTPQVDLELTKVASSNSVISGDTLTYTLTLRNNGPDDATGVKVLDQLPAGVSHASDTPSQGSYDSGTGIWTVGALANGAIATLAIDVTIDP